jgi:chitinase
LALYINIDFDWEYPGADDRGGGSHDGVNYTALLKELRVAIEASGKDYLVTFTAPTSYWYLQHFDIANMVRYVDWVNLMSYDLHGVWDSSDPIRNQVLAHTNLTEIDLALDLVSESADYNSLILSTFKLTYATHHPIVLAC